MTDDVAARPAYVRLRKAVEGWKLDVSLSDDVHRQLAEFGRAQIVPDDNSLGAELDVIDPVPAGTYDVAEMWINR